MSAENPRVDIEVSNLGSLALFRPHTDSARLHLEENCPDATWFGGALVCEHRFAGDLVEALRGNGFVVE